MTNTETAGDLGPFAPDHGRPGVAAIAGVGAGMAALLAGLLRLGLNLSGADGFRVLSTIGELLAALGIVAALVALYEVGVRGLPGRKLARVGLTLSTIAGIFVFLYAADRDGSLQLHRFFDAYFNTGIIRRILPDLGKGLVNTMEAALVAQAVALAVGLLFATLSLSERPWLRWPARAYIDVVRGMPLLVLAFLIAFGLPRLGVRLPFFAKVVLILAVNASAYISEIFRAGIQAIPRGQVDAARSLGMPSGAAMMYVVIPQAVRSVIPPLMSEFIALVKDTAIVFLSVGVTVISRDLFTAARSAASSTFSATPFVMAAFAYMLVTIPLTRLVDRLERRLRTGLA
ncbi:MAG TPA: amino acid ABC transporter permease [Actinomycetota bacterium]